MTIIKLPGTNQLTWTGMDFGDEESHTAYWCRICGWWWMDDEKPACTCPRTKGGNDSDSKG